MSPAEASAMGWTASNRAPQHAAARRRCCPVCKAECTVGSVVPIYVRDQGEDGTGRNDGETASASASASAALASASASAPASASASAPAPSSFLGLRRRRPRREAPAREVTPGSATGSGSTDSLSTLGDGTEEIYVGHRPLSQDVPSRPMPTAQQQQQQQQQQQREQQLSQLQWAESSGSQHARHERRHSGSAPLTPLATNRQVQAGGGIPPVPTATMALVSPRSIRQSSLSNGFSLSFLSSVVDAVTGGATNGSAPHVGGGSGAGRGGDVPPIHRPVWAGGVNASGRGDEGGGGGAMAHLPRDALAGVVSADNFAPAPIDDATTAFLSRLLLMLGSFVIFCLLLF